MHTIFIYERSPGRLTLSFVKSDYVRDTVFHSMVQLDILDKLGKNQGVVSKLLILCIGLSKYVIARFRDVERISFQVGSVFA